MGTKVTHTDSSNTTLGQSKITKVYTRVFYNSKFSGTKKYDLLQENKVIGNTHSKHKTNKATGRTIKTRPTTGHLYSNSTFNGKVGIANQLDHCSPVDQVEVSVISPCRRVTKNLTTHSDKKVQGTINAVAPVIETNAGHENAFNIEGKASTKSDSPNKESVDHTVPRFDIHNMYDWDKFLNTVCPRRIRALIEDNKASHCVEFHQWRAQSEFDFGFIPLSSFKTPCSLTANTDPLTPFQAHSVIRASGVPNFLKSRIPVQTQLCVDQWQEVLKGYWDTQLLDLLRFGFPLDYDRNSILQADSKNHSSATEFPEDIEAYLKEEVQFGAILGPFHTDPIPDCHKSPFMTREKPNSTHRRVIVDLSWPKGFSVNTGVNKDSYLGTDFVLSLPTIDHITSCVKASGPGTHLYKVDISRAFRHVKIDPGDLDLLGLSWGDATYIDTCLPFGSRHGSQIFQRISDTVRHVMRQHGFTVINYVDDFIGVATPSVARRSCVFLQDLLKRLGLDVSVKKLVPPGTRVVCLSIEVDTRQRTVSIPEEKMHRIVDMVDAWASKRVCTKRELQSLLGNLLYVHICVAPARMFLNRMLELLRSNYDASVINLTQDFKRDLRWFSAFLSKYNGISFYDHVRTQHTVELDACLSGLGGR